MTFSITAVYQHNLSPAATMLNRGQAHDRVILRHPQAIQQSLQVKRKGILSIIENKHRRAVTTAIVHICILSSRRSPNNIDGDRSITFKAITE
ncbi:hypothetical protein REG_0310 [Candidatus Regiella insecticola LSR1]|uniref:Uncharacterized protein n=1 Tax=Candidatus Regiella insecticola LSR1 TaxID=663321 RepID=E0WQW0_9ENTR|nr:hypothetical protein REG_0310 [Candidatus Regiella insecticola LSR1]